MIVPFLVVPVVVFDLDASDGGFAEGGSTGQWDWGIPTSGPGGATPLWATVLDGPYLNDSTDTLEVPLPDLGANAEPVLVVGHWYDVRTGDSARVEFESATGWEVLAPVYGYPDPDGFVGTSGGVVQASFDLAGLPPAANVRFVLESDVSGSAAGWYVSEVGVYDGDATPPLLAPISTPTDTQDLVGPYRVRLAAIDDHGLTEVSIRVRTDGVDETTILATPDGPEWLAEIPAQPPGTVVDWYAVASDAENSVRWPTGEDASFRVYLAAPTGLSGPAGRIVGTETMLTWTAPVSPEVVIGYRVVETGREDAPVDVTTASAVVPLSDGSSHEWTVTAEYGAGFGDPSAPLSLDVEVPALDRVDPSVVYAGETRWVELVGRSWTLTSDTAALDLGERVTVTEVEVLDAGSLRARVEADEAAAAGPRDATITGALGSWTFDDALTIGAFDDRPRILGVTPSSISQGEEVEARFVASVPFSGDVSVRTDADLVVTGVAAPDGTDVAVLLFASGFAAPGPHTIVLDDGDRLWTAEIDVTERVVDAGGGCGCGAGAPLGAAPMLISAYVLSRRTRRRR